MSGLNIKNPEAEAKIRELAALTNAGITETIMNAIDAQLRVVRAQANGGNHMDELEAICARFQAAWGDTPMPSDDDLYDYLDEG